MIAASGFIYANLRIKQDNIERIAVGDGYGYNYWGQSNMGWPFTFFERRELLVRTYAGPFPTDAEPKPQPFAISEILSPAEHPKRDVRMIDHTKMGLNICILIVVELFVAVLSESVLCRREDRMP